MFQLKIEGTRVVIKMTMWRELQETVDSYKFYPEKKE